MLNEELKNIQPGDKLLLRTWEDMAEEYRIDHDGDIDPGFLLPGYFLKRNRCFTGTIVTVREIDEKEVYFWVEEISCEIYPWCVEKVVNVQLKHTGMMEKLLKRKETF